MMPLFRRYFSKLEAKIRWEGCRPTMDVRAMGRKCSGSAGLPFLCARRMLPQAWIGAIPGRNSSLIADQAGLGG